MLERRVVGIDLHLRQKAHHVAVVPGFAQRVFETLHQQVRDSALAVGDAHVHAHRRNAIAAQHLAHQDLPDHRPIAVGDHEFVVRAHDRQQRPSGAGRVLALLLDGARPAPGMNRVAANRD